uniref:Protein PsbN n=1 Tax=Aegilops tauschii subsp. strangulata TaxID=200361 RepID=A0A452YY14_AEGTS
PLPFQKWLLPIRSTPFPFIERSNRQNRLLVSFTGYALYTAFGQPSQQLRDPFEEHGD